MPIKGTIVVRLSRDAKVFLTGKLRSRKRRATYWGGHSNRKNQMKKCCCVLSDYKNDKIMQSGIVPGGKRITLRIYSIAFILHYKLYIAAGYEISHQCGRRDCVEPTHLHSELKKGKKSNKSRDHCHAEIEKMVQKWIVSKRTGTVYWPSCPHGPHKCFKNFPRVD